MFFKNVALLASERILCLFNNGRPIKQSDEIDFWVNQCVVKPFWILSCIANITSRMYLKICVIEFFKVYLILAYIFGDGSLSILLMCEVNAVRKEGYTFRG